MTGNEAFDSLMAELRKAAQKADQIARQAAQKDPEPECECCGCPDMATCLKQEDDEELAEVLYNIEDEAVLKNTLLKTLMLMAKYAGYPAVATAAFELWLDAEE